MSEKFEPIIIKGGKFFYETSGRQFFVKGTIYSPTASSSDDVLAEKTCNIDASEMKILGINVVYVWALGNSLNLPKCLKAYQDAGVYVIIQIHRLQTWEGRWNSQNYDALMDLADSYAIYPNILGFVFADRQTSGNETTGLTLPGPASANLKAAVRDLKLHMQESGYRKVPVGVAGSQTNVLVPSIEAPYLLCGNSTQQKIDFWVQFLPSRCYLRDNIDLIISRPVYNSYGIPLLMGDYACDEKHPPEYARDYREIKALYTSELSKVWSGGTIYKWRNDESNNGMQNISVEVRDSSQILAMVRNENGVALGNTFLRTSIPVISMSDYQPLRPAYPACPAYNQVDWPIHANIPPSPRSEVCECMSKSVSCNVDTSMPALEAEDAITTYCKSNPKSCLGIRTEFETGQYGAFSFCTTHQKLSWQLSYIRGESSNTTSCSNGAVTGLGKYVNVKLPASNDTRCRTLLASAGPLGDQTIAFEVATVTSGSGGSSVTAAVNPTDKNNTDSASPSSSSQSIAVQNSNLAPGTIAGISVGIAALIAILLGAYLFWRKRRRGKRMSDAEGLQVSSPDYQPIGNVELEGGSEAVVLVAPIQKERAELSVAIPKSESVSLETGNTEHASDVTRVVDTGHEVEVKKAGVDGDGIAALGTEGQLVKCTNATSIEGAEEALSPSWASGSWFDSTDPRQGLTASSPPLGVEKSAMV